MSVSQDQLRKRRHSRIRAKIKGTEKRPRLSVFRSSTSIYAQLINDDTGTVLASASSHSSKKRGVEAAQEVGLELAKLAKQKKVAECVFDRGGYLYHGRVKSLADGARDGGLKF